MSDNTPQFLLSKIHNFMLEAGAYALAAQGKVQVREKVDKTVVTEADEQVTKIFYTHFAQEIARSDVAVIDEETGSQNIGDVFDKTEYQFILDPIDGTQPFSVGQPLWGISLGVLKKGKPYLGAIYLPKLHEYYFCDDAQSYFAIAPDAVASVMTEPKVLVTKEQTSAFVAIAGSSSGIAKLPKAYTQYRAAVIGGSWMFKGSMGGHVFHLSIWDIAAMLSIGDKLGLKFYTRHAVSIDVFTADLFDEKWALRDYIIFCKPENIETILSDMEFVK